MCMQYLIKKNRSPSYINPALRFIRAYFRCAVEADYLRSKPVEIINRQHQGKALINTFSIEEVRALLNVFDFSTCLPEICWFRPLHSTPVPSVIFRKRTYGTM